MRKGWFKIPGVQDGDRTVDEQMAGLDRLVKFVPGKSVLDLGCAEGMIAQRLLEAGAVSVLGIDCADESLAAAERANAAFGDRARFLRLNLNRWRATARYEVVLLLAIIHKMRDPQAFIVQAAASCGELAVVRLPHGSTGRIVTKHNRVECDVNAEMEASGFLLDGVESGPRDERVQYWIKR